MAAYTPAQADCEITALHRLIGRLVVDNNALKQRVDELQSLSLENNVLKQSKNELESRAAQSEQKVEEKQTALGNLTVETNAQKQRIEVLENKVAEQEQLSREKDKLNDHLTSDISAWEQRYHALKRQVAPPDGPRKKRKLAELVGELEEARTSRGQSPGGVEIDNAEQSAGPGDDSTDHRRPQLHNEDSNERRILRELAGAEESLLDGIALEYSDQLSRRKRAQELARGYI
jgi:chromosome segregation ATPase